MSPADRMETVPGDRILQAPRFWHAPPRTRTGRCLCRIGRPLTWGYRLGLALHQRSRRRRARSLPAIVISVGNLVVGGTGKTPITLWLARKLAQQGRRVAILSRGYGRDHGQVQRVPVDGSETEQWRRFGDEPVMLAQLCGNVPVWVGSARSLSGARAIREDGAAILILDDGFQHLGLERDLDLVLLDAVNPFGNGCLLPLGPMREPVSHLGRADAFILMGGDDPGPVQATQTELARRFPGQSIFCCQKSIQTFTIGCTRTAVPLRRIRSKRVVAFAGIAHPNRFFQALRELGLALSQTLAFPDHHAFSAEDLDRILRATRRHGADYLITTEKDMVRLPPWLRSVTIAAGLQPVFADGGSALLEWLMRRIDG